VYYYTNVSAVTLPTVYWQSIHVVQLHHYRRRRCRRLCLDGQPTCCRSLHRLVLRHCLDSLDMLLRRRRGRRPNEMKVLFVLCCNDSL
jgi:hypothetical protein